MTLLPNALGSAWPVRLPIFEGPLDLLLHLIEREELEISEISLVAVTDQYIKAIEGLEEIEPGALADFLVIAARLLYLKSRSLLPKPRPPEEDDEEESGDALIQQLLEYRQFKVVAEGLRLREEAGLRAFVRLAPPPHVERKLDLGNVSVDKLAAAVQKALRRIPSDPPKPRVQTYPITVAEQIEVVRQRVRAVEMRSSVEPLRFSALLSAEKSRLEIVVTFLAVLELIKQREIVAEQEGVFGEIVLRAVEGTMGNSTQVT
ncbi:MAG: segregation/condensation protein A [Chloroflexi bacterium]|nr:segregation/condensation protein A [Chloroflexota bacterium]